MKVGARLRWLGDGTRRLTYRDVWVMLNRPDPGSALGRWASDGWTPEAQLLALLADRINIQIWQRTKDGAKGINMPKPIPRPGIKTESGPETETIGEAHTAAELEEAFAHMWGR